MSSKSIRHTRDLFLFSISLIYLAAFASLYVQIPGLYGDNGILPAKLVVKSASSWDELLQGIPTLLKLTPKLRLTVQQGMDLLCFCGLGLSFLCVIFAQMRDTVSFILLWMLYFSLYQVGQTFLWFQWDILLLEAGFLTILLAPFNLQMPIKRFKVAKHHQHDSIMLWLVRWLLFRLMYMSGVVKLTSRCPTWWGLTALNWHFESQCIPTPLAWYFHQLPDWFLRLSVAITFFIEIAVPFLFFAPVRSLRLFAFWAQILLQVMIILTGNYNFFNLLTMALCISLLDDKFLGYKQKKKSNGSVINYIAAMVAYGFLGCKTWQLFGMELTDKFTIESKITFTEKEFDMFVAKVTPWTIWFAAFSFAFEVLTAFIRCFTEIKEVFWKNWAAVQCAIFTLVGASMLAISLVPYATLHKDIEKVVPHQAVALHSRVSDFHLASSYGLFRRMTGVGGRPEVVIEGSNSLENGWREYEFFYKPGAINRRPPVVAPHQPRLDWQMWFAALGSYQHNPWFLNLVYRLLDNETDVLDLIQYNPFPNKPPKYIRAQLYKYHYTKYGTDKNSSGWWTRELTREYLPALSKDDSSLVSFMKQTGIIESGKKSKSGKSDASFVSRLVSWIRRKIGQPEGFVFVMTVILTALTTKLITRTILS
ncbi:lipase maturation factor 2-like isoform X2 [Dreissena polymorpha]|uniref:lipase maturation factor 2-like isoform X2 n=1 Tax=Dreissena polymorpha TaxID=45954 RepID=UPI0022651169|nr:lipase maturation factor 2-like isoform X2 [Dreissena polymorpha]